jgi:hypothetical protein
MYSLPDYSTCFQAVPNWQQDCLNFTQLQNRIAISQKIENSRFILKKFGQATVL